MLVDFIMSNFGEFLKYADKYAASFIVEAILCFYEKENDAEFLDIDETEAMEMILESFCKIYSGRI